MSLDAKRNIHSSLETTSDRRPMIAPIDKTRGKSTIQNHDADKEQEGNDASARPETTCIYTIFGNKRNYFEQVSYQSCFPSTSQVSE